MKKFIFIVSLIFSLHGILAGMHFLFFKFEDFNELGYNLLFSAEPYYFRGLNIQYILTKTDTSSTTSTLGLLNLFFYLSFLVGSILYIASKYKETKLLIFNYCLMIIHSVMALFSMSLYFLSGKESGPYLFFHLGVFIFHIIISIFFISKLNHKELKTYIEHKNDKDVVYLDNAPKSKRFLNLLIDNIITVSIAYWFVDAASSNEHIGQLLTKIESVFGERFGALVFLVSIKFIYYIVFEALFSVSPGKVLTNTAVADEDGNKIPFANLFKRTLIRFIPFESISFLTGSNLHDAYSYSYVINKKQSSNNSKLYLIFMGIGFLMALLIYFYKILINI